MFDKKTNTYFFCKRELIEGLFELSEIKNRALQALVLCAAKVIVKYMPITDSISIEDLNDSKS